MFTEKKTIVEMGLTSPESQIISYQIPGKNQSIEVAVNLPYETIAEMIQWTIDLIVDDRNYISPMVAAIGKDFALLKYCTNIDLSELENKQMSIKDLYELYDILTSNGIIKFIRDNFNSEQLAFFENNVDATGKTITDYRTSFLGIFEEFRTKLLLDKDKFEELIGDVQALKDYPQISNLLNMYEELGTPIKSTTDKLEK